MDAAVGDVLRIDLGDRVEGPGPGPVVFVAASGSEAATSAPYRKALPTRRPGGSQHAATGAFRSECGS